MRETRSDRSTIPATSSQPQTNTTTDRTLTAATAFGSRATTRTTTTTTTVPQGTAIYQTMESRRHQEGMNVNTSEEGGNTSSSSTEDHEGLSTCSQEQGPGDATTTQANIPAPGALLVRKYTALVSSIGNHLTTQNSGSEMDESVDMDVKHDSETRREVEPDGDENDNYGCGEEVNEEENENNIGQKLFKRYDDRTGQFLRGDSSLTKEEFGIKRLFNRDDNKFRSHSVPAICHSSLRRLAAPYCQNHNHYHYRQHNNSPSTVGSIKKKRAAKPQNNNRHHHHNHRHCLVQGTPMIAFSNSTGSSGSSATASTTDSTTSSRSSSRNSSRCANGNDTGATSFLDDPKQPTMLEAENLTRATTSIDANTTSAVGPSLIHRPRPHGKSQLMSKGSLRDAILLCHQTQQSLVTKYDEYDELTLQERISAIRDHPKPLPLPPINLQCLKEIDLQEIVKNPQLRHDIIFDPLLQFRPNLDGERGLKKKQLSDRYWKNVENEVYVYSRRPQVFEYNHTRLVPLFDTLREVLLSIVPQREVHIIHNVLDTELNVQELLRGSLIMTSLSEWLARLFKHHCAPMRDTWVDRMSLKFREAERESSLSKLIEGLRLVFQILEAMKLDIANHQIRILRPALLSNSVEFEKQYFQSLMNSDRVDLKSSLLWFKRKFNENVNQGKLQKEHAVPRDIYKLCIQSIISLLSCRKMVREYPTSLSFDHARLILLRADIRQIVCLLICRLLFKQLVANDNSLDKGAKNFLDSDNNLKKLRTEIISIITDEHGNCRWTKNTMAIAIHLCKTITDLKNYYFSRREHASPRTSSASSSTTSSGGTPSTTPALAQAKIDFAKSWLSKQTQPLSDVYGVLEDRVFRSLEDLIFSRSECTVDGRVKQDFVYLCSNSNNDATSINMSPVTTEVPSAVPSTPSTNDVISSTAASSVTQNGSSSTASALNTARTTLQGIDMEEFDNVFRHLYAVVNFHWSVFGTHYMDAINDQIGTRPS